MSVFKETKSTKACGGCPFKRNNTGDQRNPGGSHPFVYLGQIHGPFWLPCHNDKNYEGVGSDVSLVTQCRGAAIFRSNCKSYNKLPKELLSLPTNPKEVFANEKEFVQHYLGVDETMAEMLTEPEDLMKYTSHEMHKVSASRRYYDSEGLE